MGLSECIWSRDVGLGDLVKWSLGMPRVNV